MASQAQNDVAAPENSSAEKLAEQDVESSSESSSNTKPDFQIEDTTAQHIGQGAGISGGRPMKS